MAASIVQDILNSFDPNSKEEWKVKASQDLKGKSLEALSWQLNESILLSPYYTASDVPEMDTAILKESNPDWQVGEHYEITDYAASNKQILNDLMHGLTAPCFLFNSTPSLEDLEALFEGIGLEHIDCHFTSNDSGTYINWLALLKKRGIQASAYFYLDAALTSSVKSIHINASAYYKGPENVHEEIKNSLLVASAMLSQASDKQLLADQLQFTFLVDNAYLINIAKLRAFKLLWVFLMKELNLNVSLPFIKVNFAPEAYGKDEEDNLIKATSMAMSAVLGGANHLVVRPISSTLRSKRLARNIQLILKHESGLNKVVDPAQGSYYIESLTHKLVNYCK
ncbi:methylmalonyl-CoA mutase family protein [Chitinophagales bacterium]|nr:methylmalonyl-CoA mutase family protein [Chitinophagales bacterium]